MLLLNYSPHLQEPPSLPSRTICMEASPTSLPSIEVQEFISETAQKSREDAVRGGKNVLKRLGGRSRLT